MNELEILQDLEKYDFYSPELETIFRMHDDYKLYQEILNEEKEVKNEILIKIEE